MYLCSVDRGRFSIGMVPSLLVSTIGIPIVQIQLFDICTIGISTIGIQLCKIMNIDTSISSTSTFNTWFGKVFHTEWGIALVSIVPWQSLSTPDCLSKLKPHRLAHVRLCIFPQQLYWILDALSSQQPVCLSRKVTLRTALISATFLK